MPPRRAAASSNMGIISAGTPGSATKTVPPHLTMAPGAVPTRFSIGSAPFGISAILSLAGVT
jgi:hypothetical protein